MIHDFYDATMALKMSAALRLLFPARHTKHAASKRGHQHQHGAQVVKGKESTYGNHDRALMLRVYRRRWGK